MLEVLRSGRLSLGPRWRQFEEALRRSGSASRHVAAVSSGTGGPAPRAARRGMEAGDEVITTPFSFVASANSVLYEGARPVFCDIERAR